MQYLEQAALLPDGDVCLSDVFLSVDTVGGGHSQFE
jgi:hypothetical protein